MRRTSRQKDLHAFSSGEQSVGESPRIPVPPSCAPVPTAIPPAPAVPPAEALPLSFLVELGDPGLLPRPVVDLVEDEDIVIARLFPSDIPEPSPGEVPAPPTLTFSPDGVLVRNPEYRDKDKPRRRGQGA